MDTYKIVRMYADDETPSRTILKGLTLQQAREWCRRPDTNSTTATSKAAVEHTSKYGQWFDGYEREQS